MRGHPKSERFFTAEEKERLKAITHEVESKTIGEIVIMVLTIVITTLRQRFSAVSFSGVSCR